ncbi:MAG: hypothetical protein AAF533_18335 [Acidobacteriota bacterium]
MFPVQQPRRMTAQEQADYANILPTVPNLANLWVLGPETQTYNCLAWSLGITFSWIWPWQGNVSQAQFDLLYNALGDPPQVAATGVAGYGLANNQRTHASVRLNVTAAPAAGGPVGVSWTSKLGRLLLVTHGHHELDNDPDYGTIQGYYQQNNGPSVTNP